jgi:DNA-binding FrmR family transcriptional regulator
MKSKTDVVNRARRIEGQARGIQRMIEEGRECAQIVQQIAALRAAVDRLGYQLVISNLRDCLESVEVPKGAERELEASLAALSGMRT